MGAPMLRRVAGWRIGALARDVARLALVGLVAAVMLGPGVPAALGGLVVLRESLLFVGLATRRRRLLRSAFVVDAVVRRALGLLASLTLAAFLARDDAVGHAMALIAVPGAAPVTLHVEAGRVQLCFHTPAVLELPCDSEEDERLAMVLCRLVKTPGGRAALTHQAIADAFGKNSRQHCQNHLQKFMRAGGSLARMVLNGRSGRPPVVHPVMRERIGRLWERDPLVSIEQTRARLAAEPTAVDVPVPTIEQLRAMRHLDGNLVLVRGAVRRLVERDGCGLRSSVLQRQLFEVVDAQDERLRRAGSKPAVLSGSLELARELAPSPTSKRSRTAEALLGALRRLVTVPRAEQEEQLVASIGAEHLAPLHYGVLYCLLGLSIGQVAALVRRSKSVVYRGLVRLCSCLDALDPWPAAKRFSGVLALDEKWVKIPKSYTKDEREKGKRWRYAHFAVDALTGDLLHVDIFERCDGDSVRAFLVDLRAKGIRPRVVVTDMLGAYANAIRETFGAHVVHHYCLFHHLQAVRHRLRDKLGPDWKKHALLRRLVTRIDDIYHCKTRRTARRRLARVLTMRDEVLAHFPDVGTILDTLEKRFPLVANAIGRSHIPTTNNVTERTIKAFHRHYRAMAGLESIETAHIQLRLFRFFYRLAPLREPARKEDRGLSPAEKAGFTLRAVPIADYVRRFCEAWEEDGPLALREEPSRALDDAA